MDLVSESRGEDWKFFWLEMVHHQWEFKNVELKSLLYIYIILSGMALLPSESLMGSDTKKNVLLAVAAIPKDWY